MTRWFIVFSFPLFMTPASPASAQGMPSLLILGDSLSAEYGMAVGRGWTHLLRERLRVAGYNYKVENASISGDTSLGALTRLREMEGSPNVAIVSIGGNDGLRGLSVADLRRNLSAIVDHLTAEGARVLLLRMRAPPNYGPVYTEAFSHSYEMLVGDNVSLGPFILANLIDQPDLMQADGLHPTAKAQPVILDTIWPYLEPLLTGQ